MGRMEFKPKTEQNKNSSIQQHIHTWLSSSLYPSITTITNQKNVKKPGFHTGKNAMEWNGFNILRGGGVGLSVFVHVC